MVNMNAITTGAMGLIVAVVAIVVGVVITNKLQGTLPLASDGNLSTAGLAASNGTDFLGSILSDWGSIIVLGLVLISVLAPLLLALIQVGRAGEGR